MMAFAQGIKQVAWFCVSRTAILFIIAALLFYFLVDSERMKLKALNRVVPQSMEILADFNQHPSKEQSGILQGYTLFFKTTSKILPNSAAAHGMLGYCYYYSGHQRKALDSYRKAAALHPTFFWFQYNLAVIYFEQGLYGPAAEVLEKAVACRPEDAIVFTNVSKIYRDLNHYAEDLGYDSQNGLVAGYRYAHELLAKCYYHLGKYREIFVILENAARLRLHPQDELYYYSGLVALASKDNERAIGFFQKTLKENPQKQDAYYYLGFTLDRMGLKDMADKIAWRRVPQGGQHYQVRIF
jgi:tetratricopeptide (TPR) repeat protein